jgi:hypothetical protein
MPSFASLRPSAAGYGRSPAVVVAMTSKVTGVSGLASFVAAELKANPSMAEVSYSGVEIGLVILSAATRSQAL